MVLDCWVMKELHRNFRISLIEPEIRSVTNYNGTTNKYAYWGLNLLNTVQKDQFSFPFYKQGSEFYIFYLNKAGFSGIRVDTFDLLIPG